LHSEKQERRFLLYNVSPSQWLHPVCCYKRHLKEEEGLLVLLLAFMALLWAFWCGKLLEGKRIIEGKNC
jgi:hypothetical protein